MVGEETLISNMLNRFWTRSGNILEHSAWSSDVKSLVISRISLSDAGVRDSSKRRARRDLLLIASSFWSDSGQAVQFPAP
jgi:hypothetical protein